MGSSLRSVWLENTRTQQHPKLIAIDPFFGNFSVLHLKNGDGVPRNRLPFTSYVPILDRKTPAPVPRCVSRTTTRSPDSKMSCTSVANVEYVPLQGVSHLIQQHPIRVRLLKLLLFHFVIDAHVPEVSTSSSLRSRALSWARSIRDANSRSFASNISRYWSMFTLHPHFSHGCECDQFHCPEGRNMVLLLRRLGRAC